MTVSHQINKSSVGKTTGGQQPPVASNAALQEKILQRYSEQIPKPFGWGRRLGIFVGIIGSIASILGLGLLLSPSSLNFLMTLIHGEQSGLEAPLAVSEYYLVFLSFSAISWAIYRTQSTPRRLSEEVYYTHQAMHVIRDYVSSAVNDSEEVIEASQSDAIQILLNSCEKAFTLITRRKCVASIKIMCGESSVITRYTSDDTAYPIGAQGARELSSFSSLSDIVNSDSRFYICNDVWMGFRNGNYWHPDLVGLEVQGVLRSGAQLVWEMVFPRRKPLYFRSTLVVPIRNVSVEGIGGLTEHSPYFYWGFLCIDSRSRRSFRARLITEVGAQYADALAVVFSFAEHLDEQRKQENV